MAELLEVWLVLTIGLSGRENGSQDTRAQKNVSGKSFAVGLVTPLVRWYHEI